MLDEHGLPVPPEHVPIPLWIERERFVDIVRDADDQEVNLWDSPDFFVHAANWIIPCREIVRRLSVWYDESGKPGGSVSFNVIEVSRDAASLWAKMQEKAKGGDGETSV